MSRVPATLDRLYEVAQASVTAPTLAFRGPFITGDPSNALFVGYDGDPAGDFRAVNVVSSWAGLGARARDEEFDVFCAVTVLSGDNDIPGATTAAYAIYYAFENALRADPDLNQGPPFTAGVNTGELFTMPHPAGLQVRLGFTVHVKTRI